LVGLFLQTGSPPSMQYAKTFIKTVGLVFVRQVCKTRSCPATKLKVLTEDRDDGDEGKQCALALSKACTGLQAALDMQSWTPSNLIETWKVLWERMTDVHSQLFRAEGFIEIFQKAKKSETLDKARNKRARATKVRQMTEQIEQRGMPSAMLAVISNKIITSDVLTEDTLPCATQITSKTRSPRTSRIHFCFDLILRLPKNLAP